MVLGGIVGVNAFIDQKVASIPRVKLNTAPNTDPGSPANFLLIGSDSRAFVQTPEEAQAFGNQAANGGQHSDTLMVIHVDPAQQTGYLVSFPRDLEVDIPGMGMQKINAAYDIGPQKVIDTLAQDFNIPIQHYFEVDFQSFQGIVDAMGGVSIYIPAPARDAESGFSFIPFNFHPGCYVLDGSQALAYARSRRTLPTCIASSANRPSCDAWEPRRSSSPSMIRSPPTRSSTRPFRSSRPTTA